MTTKPKIIPSQISALRTLMEVAEDRRSAARDVAMTKGKAKAALDELRRRQASQRLAEKNQMKIEIAYRSAIEQLLISVPCRNLKCLVEAGRKCWAPNEPHHAHPERRELAGLTKMLED